MRKKPKIRQLYEEAKEDGIDYLLSNLILFWADCSRLWLDQFIFLFWKNWLLLIWWLPNFWKKLTLVYSVVLLIHLSIHTSSSILRILHILVAFFQKFIDVLLQFEAQIRYVDVFALKKILIKISKYYHKDIYFVNEFFEFFFNLKVPCVY